VVVARSRFPASSPESVPRFSGVDDSPASNGSPASTRFARTGAFDRSQRSPCASRSRTAEAPGVGRSLALRCQAPTLATGVVDAGLHGRRARACRPCQGVDRLIREHRAHVWPAPRRSWCRRRDRRTGARPATAAVGATVRPVEAETVLAGVQIVDRVGVVAAVGRSDGGVTAPWRVVSGTVAVVTVEPDRYVAHASRPLPEIHETSLNPNNSAAHALVPQRHAPFFGSCSSYSSGHLLAALHRCVPTPGVCFSSRFAGRTDVAGPLAPSPGGRLSPPRSSCHSRCSLLGHARRVAFRARRSRSCRRESQAAAAQEAAQLSVPPAIE